MTTKSENMTNYPPMLIVIDNTTKLEIIDVEKIAELENRVIDENAFGKLSPHY